MRQHEIIHNLLIRVGACFTLWRVPPATLELLLIFKVLCPLI